MNRKIVFIFFGVLLSLSYLFSQESTHSGKWTTFEPGIQKAKQSGKKILIDVYTDWCSWCKKMDATTYSDEKVQKYLNDKFIIIKLDAEAAEKIKYKEYTLSPAEFSQGMGVSGYPATLFMESNGEVITLLPGYVDAPKFIHILKFIGENEYKTKKFDVYLSEQGVKF